MDATTCGMTPHFVWGDFVSCLGSRGDLARGKHEGFSSGFVPWAT